jgi:hypothetical protein
MKYLFILIRFPFFLLGAYFIASFLCIVIIGLAIYWLFILPPFWLLILVPIGLVGEAFSKRHFSTDEFTTELSSAIKGWCQPLVDLKKLETYMQVLKDCFGPIWNWLIRGNESEGSSH